MKKWLSGKTIRILFLTSTLLLFSSGGKIFIETNSTKTQTNQQISERGLFLPPMQNARVIMLS